VEPLNLPPGKKRSVTLSSILFVRQRRWDYNFKEGFNINGSASQGSDKYIFASVLTKASMLGCFLLSFIARLSLVVFR
jgi:hypothetical protein